MDPDPPNEQAPAPEFLFTGGGRPRIKYTSEPEFWPDDKVCLRDPGKTTRSGQATQGEIFTILSRNGKRYKLRDANGREVKGKTFEEEDLKHYDPFA